MKLRIPSKLQIWGAFWGIIGKLVLNKTFMMIALLVATYLLGVGTSRIALNAFFDTSSAVVEKCNNNLEKVGIAYRLDMPNFKAPQAIPVGEGLEFVDDPMLLPPLDNNVNIVVSDQYPYQP